MNRKLTNLEYKIHNILKLSIDPVNVSIIDSIKFLIALLNNDLVNITQNTEITSLEKYYLDLILDPNHIDFIHVTSNYFNNLLLEWHFILGNAFLANEAPPVNKKGTRLVGSSNPASDSPDSC